MAESTIATTCCIAGGGPAGMMLGFLLARAGIDVTVLEKHADFLRDFRGDTMHPSTLELMHELGLLDEFLKLPHQEVRHVCPARSATTRVTIADFSHLPTHCKFIALMPQWDFLEFPRRRTASAIPAFDLRMRAEATGLIEESGRVVGVRAQRRRTAISTSAPIWSSAADGRHSTVREQRRPRGRGPRRADGRALVPRCRADRATQPRPFGHIEAGAMMVMLNRGDYWQCAYVIPKGGIERCKRQGLDAFRDAVRRAWRRSCATASTRSQAGTTSSC